MKKVIFLLFLVIAAVAVKAQKLPNKQEESLRAPANIKVDGKADEWGNEYKAYNKGVEAFYTVANDDNNLYIIIHADKSRVIEKIIEGGISFTVNNSGKKEDKNNKTILFPLLPIPIAKGILVAAGKSLTGKTIEYDPKDIQKRTDLSISFDSIARANKNATMNKANVQLVQNLKEIKIVGIKAVDDTIEGITDDAPYYRTLPLHHHRFQLISEINNDNIKAMMRFDANAELTYELCIPIKYLDIQISNGQKFAYNITINGRGEDGRPGNLWEYNPPGIEPRIKNQDMEEPTDLWGEYTLAKNN